MPTNQPDPKQPPTTFDDTEAHMGRFIAPVEEPETEAHARHAPAEEPQS
jgi:hypothetical protein